MKLPNLKFIEDKNTYENVFDSYSSEIHCAVVKAWLFEDLSYRTIDSQILNLDPDFTLGYESMHIIHYLGINNDFKGEFKKEFEDKDLNFIICKFESCSDGYYDDLINVFKILNNNDSREHISKEHVSNEEIKTLFLDQDVLDKISASLNSGKNIILNGVPGTGKTHLATIFAEKAMCDEGYILTTATSDWTTFDTIGGLMPDEMGKLIFHEGKFLQAIREDKWLIIDEINRADIDKAFGQLFTVLSNQNVELPYSIKNNDGDNIPIKIKLWDKCYSEYIDDDATYYIGKNWRIIATMNSYDKDSLFDLSYAFMRRFTFIEIEVPKKFQDLIDIWKKNPEIADFIESTKNFIPKLKALYSINEDNDSLNINRQLGPAIFLDVIKYLNFRLDLEETNNYDDKIFSEAVSAFIIPQFEGLSRKKLESLENFFVDEIFDDKDIVQPFVGKLNELKPFY